MRKDIKGVTLISVLVIVLALTILTSVITISVKGIIKDTFKKEFISEYNLVKASVNDYIVRNSGIIDFEEDVIDISDIDQEDLNQFKSGDIENGEIDVYVIDLEKIGVHNATYGINSGADQDDIYVLSKNTKTVYYKKGFNNSSHVYYIAVED